MEKLEQFIYETLGKGNQSVGLREFLTQLIMFEKNYSREKSAEIVELFLISRECHSIFDLDSLIQDLTDRKVLKNTK